MKQNRVGYGSEKNECVLKQIKFVDSTTVTPQKSGLP